MTDPFQNLDTGKGNNHTQSSLGGSGTQPIPHGDSTTSSKSVQELLYMTQILIYPGGQQYVKSWLVKKGVKNNKKPKKKKEKLKKAEITQYEQY